MFPQLLESFISPCPPLPNFPNWNSTSFVRFALGAEFPRTEGISQANSRCFFPLLFSANHFNPSYNPILSSPPETSLVVHLFLSTFFATCRIELVWRKIRQRAYPHLQSQTFLPSKVFFSSFLIRRGVSDSFCFGASSPSFSLLPCSG